MNFGPQRILVLKILTLYRQPLQTPSLQPPYTLLSRHQSNTYQTFQTPSRYPTETLQAASRHPLDNLQKPSSHNPDTNTRHPLDTHIGPTAVCTCIMYTNQTNDCTITTCAREILADLAASVRYPPMIKLEPPDVCLGMSS